LVRQPCGCPVPATTIDGGLSSVGGTARPSAVAVLRLRTGATRRARGPLSTSTILSAARNCDCPCRWLSNRHKNYIRMTNALKDIQGPMRDAKRVELSPKLLHELH
jgi:hypothetical protein